MNMPILLVGLAPAALYLMAFLVCFIQWRKALKEMNESVCAAIAEPYAEFIWIQEQGRVVYWRKKTRLALIATGLFAAIAIGASLLL